MAKIDSRPQELLDRTELGGRLRVAKFDIELDSADISQVILACRLPPGKIMLLGKPSYAYFKAPLASPSLVLTIGWNDYIDLEGKKQNGVFNGLTTFDVFLTTKSLDILVYGVAGSYLPEGRIAYFESSSAFDIILSFFNASPKIGTTIKGSYIYVLS